MRNERAAGDSRHSRTGKDGAFYSVPSGQVDIQNVSTGDVIKRNWNFFVNRAPRLQSLLSVDRQ